ncbi:MAG: oxidoreductase [Desulfobacterales bacterium]|nr:oxidoreductase [Desulfobacterales bacterium]
MTQDNWDAGHIPDQAGRTVIVTGANSGIGFETARTLAAKNARVILACRNRSKGREAAERIRNDLPHSDIRLLPLDLSSLDSIREFADRIKGDCDRLDLLINNAGVMIPPYGKTADGFELQMGANHFGHFALTGLLIEMIKATPGSRIVSVSSMAHKAGKIDFSDLHWTRRNYKPWQAYGDSKIANLYFIFSLADRLSASGSGVITAAAHPGWTATELQRNSGTVGFLNPLFAQGTEMGALPTLYAACSPDVKPKNYFGPRGWFEMRGYPKKVAPNKRSLDKETGNRLWKMSESLTGVSF